MRFEDLGLSEPILRAVTAEGYTIPTPIQVKAIPPVLEGRDLLGCAQTGTGKTAAFALPILHRLSRVRTHDHAKTRPTRVLILAPTRELAAQIGVSFDVYGQNTHLRQTTIFGGVNQTPQVRALREGVDILIATPGRLLDLMNQGHVDLRRVEVFVLDEADRMMDMGFINDIRKVIAKLPKERQTLFFSATMPPEIRELSKSILRSPVNVNVAPVTIAADTVEQSVYFVEGRSKPAMLEHFLNNNAVARALVFTRTKRGADRVARHLSRAGIRAEAIHGNKSQNARERAMSQFKSGAPPVLVATDIAARGLDIDDISHVINYDVPNVPETYVHRIGRTGRAGASGLAVSFCADTEREFLSDIEKLIRRKIPVSPAVRGLPAPAERSPETERRRQQQAAPQSRRQPGRPGAKPGGGPRRESHQGQPARRDHQAPAARRDHQAQPANREQPRREMQTAASNKPRTPSPTGVGHRSRGKMRRRRGGGKR